jgi:hypothetical protein
MVLTLLDEPPSKVEAALFSQGDVDEHDVWSVRLDTAQCLGPGRGDGRDGEAFSFQECARRFEKRPAVVDDQDPGRHRISVALMGSRRIAASQKPKSAGNRVARSPLASMRARVVAAMVGAPPQVSS